MADWRAVPTLDGLVDYINQQIALGRIGGALSYTAAVSAERQEWRAAAPGANTATGDRLCDYINQQIAQGKISAIPASVTSAGLGAPVDWRASTVRTGDPLCDYINQQILLGKIGGNVAPPPPGTPSLWFSARNIDGTNNSSLTDGQTVGTWSNLGSLGAGGNLVQATGGSRPFFRLVATSGKINNLPAIENTGTRFMDTASLAGSIVQPNLVAMLFRPTNLSATGEIFDQSSVTAGRQLIQQTLTTGLLNLFAGVSVVSTGLSVVAATWESIVASFNAASSFARLNGTQGGTISPGANAMDSLRIFTDNVAAAFVPGMLSEFLVYSGGGQPTPAQIETWITSIYGATPQ